MSVEIGKRSSKKIKLEEKILKKAKNHIKEPNSDEPKEIELHKDTLQVQDAPNILVEKKAKKFKSNEQKVLRNARGVILGDQLAASLLKPSYKDPNARKKKKKLKKKKRKQKEKEVQKNITKGKSLKEDCLAFLMKWENERADWKFEKMKQIWLIKNALKSNLIDDEEFEILLRFMVSIQGQARAATLSEMQNSMSKFDNKYSNDPSQATSEEKEQYNRARQIVQLLSD